MCTTGHKDIPYIHVFSQSKPFNTSSFPGAVTMTLEAPISSGGFIIRLSTSSHTESFVTQVANCFSWQHRPRKAHKCRFKGHAEDIQEVLSGPCLARCRKGKRLPVMSLLKHPSTCVCVCNRERMNNLVAWQHSLQTSLSLLPVLSLYHGEKNTLYKVLKGALGNDQKEKLHIMVGHAVL